MTVQQHESTVTRGGSLSSFASAVASLAVAAVWVLLTLWRPTVTFHFAPLLVTLAWPYASRSRLGRPLTRAESMTPVAGGAAISLLATLGLWLAGSLDGPTFWSPSGAALEAVLMTGIGVAYGLRITISGRGGPPVVERAITGAQGLIPLVGNAGPDAPGFRSFAHRSGRRRVQIDEGAFRC